MTVGRMHITNTIGALEAAKARLQSLLDKEGFTISEIKEIRRTLLTAVRFDLDPLMGHLPDQRHY